jgi:hypothetical protein
MSRTRRRDYKGDPYRDGGHGKRCPEPNCNICGIGFMKRILRRKARRERTDEK